jgi:hypothetical protein
VWPGSGQSNNHIKEQLAFVKRVGGAAELDRAAAVLFEKI